MQIRNLHTLFYIPNVNEMGCHWVLPFCTFFKCSLLAWWWPLAVETCSHSVIYCINYLLYWCCVLTLCNILYNCYCTTGWLLSKKIKIKIVCFVGCIVRWRFVTKLRSQYDFYYRFCHLPHFIAPCIVPVFFSSPPFFQRFHLSIRVPSNSKHNARGISLLNQASHIPYSWNCGAVLVCQLTTRH